MSEISASKVFFSSFAIFSRSSAFIRFTLVTVSAQSSSSSLKPSVVPGAGASGFSSFFSGSFSFSSLAFALALALGFGSSSSSSGAGAASGTTPR